MSRSAGRIFAKITPLIRKKSEISTFRPIRITKLLCPVTVHSAASPLKCRTSALMISLTQSISQNATPVSTAFQFWRSISTA